MKIAISLAYAVIVLSGIILIPNAFAESVPDWVKNTAGWWASDAISETEFVNAIEYLVKEDIIQVNVSQTSETSQSVPDWVKNTAGWWATDAISETEFVNAIAYLIKVGIINIEKNCIFEDEKYALSKFFRWALCNLDFSYLDDWAESKISKSEIKLNEYGFRGEDFSETKSPNTFRIFAVGGSTTFGNGVYDEETYPYMLQKKFDSLDLGINIEVINTGFGGAWSKTEIDLIKNKLLGYDPDLIIVYDGWNDVQNEVHNKNNNEDMWKERWKEICDLGNEKNFLTLIILQPLASTTSIEKRIPPEQEYMIWDSRIHENVKIDDAYKKYPDKLNELNEYCTETANLRNLFDETYESVFFDIGHVNKKGNETLANKIFELSLPLVLEKYSLDTKYYSDDNESSLITSEAEIQIDKNLDFRSQVITNYDFSNMNLKDASFKFSTLQNVDFSNADLENADFRFSKIENSNFNNANLKNAKFPRTDIRFSDFSGADLRNSYFGVAVLTELDFLGTNLQGANLKGSTLSQVILDETNLQNADLSYAHIAKSDFTNTNLSDLTIFYTSFAACDFTDVDLSITDFKTKNEFAGSSLRNTILPDELFNTDLTAKETYIGSERVVFAGADLSGVDLRGKDFSDVQFTHLILDTLEGVDLGYQSDIAVNLSETNFSGENLSGLKLQFIKFNNANLSGTNLSNSDLRFSDLSGANLEDANLQGAILDNAILTGANLKCINHPICVSD